MKVGIHQPNFLPWRGFFSKIKASQGFVFLDDVQFERGKTFTSRTKIALNGSPCWVTVPVLEKSKLLPISEIRVDSSFLWKPKHLNSLFHAYKKSPSFQFLYPLLEAVYQQPYEFLVQYNIGFIERVAAPLQLNAQFFRSSELLSQEELGWEKIKRILIETKASSYVSGSGAGSKRYVNETELQAMGIELHWQAPPVQVYVQPNSKEFMPDLSVVDLMFNTCAPYSLL